LHLLLQGAESLFNIVVSDNDLHVFSLRIMVLSPLGWRPLGIRSAQMAQSKEALAKTIRGPRFAARCVSVAASCVERPVADICKGAGWSAYHLSSEGLRVILWVVPNR
jgi:hypothetical protein